MVTRYIYCHCSECGNTEYDIHKSIWSLRLTSVMAKRCLHCLLKWQRARSLIWWCGRQGFCGSLLLTKLLKIEKWKQLLSTIPQASFSTSSALTALVWESWRLDGKCADVLLMCFCYYCTEAVKWNLIFMPQPGHRVTVPDLLPTVSLFLVWPGSLIGCIW